MSKIYALIDPRDDQVRYIGKTKNELKVRLRGHLEKSRNLNNKWHVANWIRSLEAEGLIPKIVEIDDLPDSEIDEAEIRYIREYRELGYDLTNNTLGGDGGITGPGFSSPERLRKAMKTRRSSGKASPLKGVKQPDELIKARMKSYTPEKRALAIEKAKAYRARNRELAKVFGGIDPYKNGIWIRGELFTSKDFCPNTGPLAVKGYSSGVIRKVMDPESRKNAIREEKIEKFKSRLNTDEELRIFESNLANGSPWNTGLSVTEESTKQLLRDAGKKQWDGYDSETKEKVLESLDKHRAKFISEVKSGIRVDPRVGKEPWNKGVTNDGEASRRGWITRRNNGFKSQGDMLKEISKAVGHSESKVTRSLKGRSHLVAVEANKEIWEYYMEHRDMFEGLIVKEII